MASLWSASGVLIAALLTTPGQAVDEAAVRAAVVRYYRAIEAEDAAAYLSLWSSGTHRPLPESVKFLFEWVDDRFHEIEVLRSVQVGARLRVRVRVRRERTRRGQSGEPDSIASDEIASLTFVSESGQWKVWSEGTPADTLAAELASAETAADREALLEAEPDLIATPLVSALNRIASNESVMQRYARALELFELVVELARRTGSRTEEGEALQNIGTALFFQRRYPEALAAYERRREFEARHGDDLAMAAAIAGISTIRYTLAEYSQALAGYRLALAIQERLDERPAAAVTLISIANVRYVQGDYPAALRDYARSRDLHRTLHDRAGEARALDGLGRTHAAQGDYAAALVAFAGVLEEGRARGDRVRQATGHQSVGEVHLRLGNLDAARDHYGQSREHFLSLGQPGNAGRSWQGLAMTELVAGRFAAAEVAYERSIAACTDPGEADCAAHAIVGLAYAQFAQQKFLQSIASYRRAIEAFSALSAGEPAARAEIGLSQALLRAGALEDAAAAAARARTVAVALGSDDVLWRALLAESRVARKSSTGGAISACRAAAGVVQRMHDEALQKPATAIPADAPSAFAALAVLHALSGEHEQAWRSAVRMRDLDVRAALAVNEREIARGLAPEEREEERARSAELLSLLAQHAREQALPRPDAVRLGDLSKRIAAAASERAAAMQTLFSRYPGLARWRGLEPAPVDVVRSKIPDGTVILDFIVDDDEVLAAVVTGGRDAKVTTHTTAVPRRELSERVAALLDERVLRDSTGWRAAASELASRLLPPAASAAIRGAKRLIILPHDVLWRVPFEALPAGGGYLADTAQVTYAGSYAALLGPESGEAAPARDLIAIGVPVLSDSSAEQLQQTAPGWKLRSAEEAARELAAAAGVYEGRATTLMGAEATERAVRESLAAASVRTSVHIAAPFRINGTSPLFSPALLSGGGSTSGAERDGQIELRDVLNMNVAARAAILSDGSAMSMRDAAAKSGIVEWAWLGAGVPALLLARWGADPAGSTLLAEFHRGLLTGSDAAAALQSARAAVRKRAEWSAPYFWAGWMIFGN